VGDTEAFLLPIHEPQTRDDVSHKRPNRTPLLRGTIPLLRLPNLHLQTLLLLPILPPRNLQAPLLHHRSLLSCDDAFSELVVEAGYLLKEVTLRLQGEEEDFRFHQEGEEEGFHFHQGEEEGAFHFHQGEEEGAFHFHQGEEDPEEASCHLLEPDLLWVAEKAFEVASCPERVPFEEAVFPPGRAAAKVADLEMVFDLEMAVDLEQVFDPEELLKDFDPVKAEIPEVIGRPEIFDFLEVIHLKASDP